MNVLQTARDFPAGTAVPNRLGILFPAVGNPIPDPLPKTAGAVERSG